MALQLLPELASAQNNKSRNPIIEIVSAGITEDIPFDGQFLTQEIFNEEKPNFFLHSSGKIVLIYKYKTNLIKLLISDDERTSFLIHTFSIPSHHLLLESNIVELKNGNIGIIYQTSLASTTYYYYRIVNIKGESVSIGSIANYSGILHNSGPALTKLASDGYLLVYVKLISGNYGLYKRTSSNFEIWSTESQIQIANLNPNQKIQNPFLYKLIGNVLMLLFEIEDDSNVSNIYFSTSEDEGINWSNALKITSYSDISAKAEHPVLAQKFLNQIYIIYNETKSAIRLSKTSQGWCGSECTGTDLSFDSANRKLYVTATNTYVGYKYLYCIAEIDVDSWIVTNCWNQNSVPAFNQIFFDENVWYQAHKGDRYLIPIGTYGRSSINAVIGLLNAQEKTITHYCFGNIAKYGIIKNVDHNLPISGTGIPQLKATFVDADAKRLYALFVSDYAFTGLRVYVGYFDLTDSGPIYNFVTIINSLLQPPDSVALDTGFFICPDQGYTLIWNEINVLNYKGALKVYNLADGAEVKNYNYSSSPEFPYHGIRHCVLVGNKIYGTFDYEDEFGEHDKRGLCEIDISTDTITYHRPTWASINDYKLETIDPMADGRLLIATNGFGITIFNPQDGTWEIFNNTTLPGMDPNPYPNMTYALVIYDDEAGMIYGGTFRNIMANWNGVIAFSEYGLLRRSKYLIANYSAGQWNFGNANNLVRGLLDYDLIAAFGPEETEGIYAFWTNMKGAELSIKWDKEGSILNLSNYLARGNEISIWRSIDGSPSRLSFTVSHGHLFDPDNYLSFYRPLLSKGRKLIVKIGENISGTKYWANQGAFFVVDAKLSYSRKSYPKMQIIAEDRRTFWDQKHIIATEYYSNAYPENILTDLLSDHLNFLPEEIDIANFDNRTPISHQWIETNIKNIIDALCERFGYFYRITVNNKFSCRKISDQNLIDHIYSNNEQLIDYTPDDSYSDFTNQIIVVGQEKSEIEVVYEEERVGTLNGTIGWWRRKKEYRVYYSPDGSRRCRNPRLVIIESATNVMFGLGGKVSEYISFEDPDGTFCEISVSSPDLTPLLIASIGIVIAAYYVGDIVVKYRTIPLGTLIQMMAIMTMMNILSAVCNFQYEIWARPIGKIRRSIQGQWNDTEFQNQIGMVMSKKIEEPLCTTIQECNQYAAIEGLTVKLQRNRRKFTKVAHLQDEEGDTIQIPHPISGLPVKIFITEITRKMLIPTMEENQGYFIDEIEGWRL